MYASAGSRARSVADPVAPGGELDVGMYALVVAGQRQQVARLDATGQCSELTNDPAGAGFNRGLLAGARVVQCRLLERSARFRDRVYT